MKTTLKIAAVMGFALAVTSPASAAIYDYTMTNGSVLSINTDTSSATLIGSDINTSMTSDSFSSFTGGASPVFSFVLDSLDGTRLVRGNWLTDNPLYSTTTHPQKLISYGPSRNNRVNLWAWWGNPIKGGDYITYIKSYSSQVPAPGMLALFGIGAAAIGMRRRKKRPAKA